MKKYIWILIVMVLPWSVSAQSNTSDQTVTIQVNEVNNIVTIGSPQFVIGYQQFDVWTAEQNPTNQMILTTNAPKERKITISSPTTGLAEIGLRVDASSVPTGADRSYTDWLVLTDIGEADVSTVDFITKIQNVRGSTHDLLYNAKATVDYDPTSDAVIDLTYTLVEK